MGLEQRSADYGPQAKCRPPRVLVQFCRNPAVLIPFRTSALRDVVGQVPERHSKAQVVKKSVVDFVLGEGLAFTV